jgi:ABC-type uncharacterized transport system auxiliary subunit
MIRAAALLAAALVALLATACSVLPQPQAVQLIDPQPEAPAGTESPGSWSLSMTRPATDPARDSSRVLVRTGDGRLQVHPSARWVAPAPELLRTVALRGLRDADTLRRIDAGIAGADRVLDTDLRRFELAETSAGDGLEFVVVFDARVVDADTAELVDARLFSSRTAVAGDEPAAIVMAVETSLSTLLEELADWLQRQPRD